MVTSGYSLTDVRGLYMSELTAYFKELVKLKEAQGELEKGSHDKTLTDEEADKKAVRDIRAGLKKLTKNK